MSTPLLIPLAGFGHPGPDWGGGPPPFAPLIGVFMFPLFLLILAGAFFLLRHRGLVGPPPWVRHHSPEHEAKRILAERFARGDISSEDFLERASVLNWNPGSEPWQQGPQGHKKKRR